jgi:hypothetical protein
MTCITNIRSSSFQVDITGSSQGLMRSIPRKFAEQVSFGLGLQWCVKHDLRTRALKPLYPRPGRLKPGPNIPQPE